MASYTLLVFVSLTLLLATASAELRKRPTAPLLAADSPTRIEGEYVVILNEDATDDEVSAHKQTVRQLMSYYSNRLGRTESYLMERHQWSIGTFKGYGAVMTDKMRDIVRDMRVVQYVECSQTYKTQQSCINQQTATWGIVRTTYHERPTIEDYSYHTTGDGVDVYIIDTGIQITHPNFGGRAVWGVDYIDSPSPKTDLNGHGTHVAGTVMSDTYGLAKKATAIAVRVLDQNGSGTTNGVISGINWVAAQGGGKRSVANMSLGGGKSTALNSAADAAVAAGVSFAVAAGNEAQLACNVSPASATNVVTVAASDESDVFAYFSNYGSCVDIIGPGVDITSTWINSGTNTISGTSMASPHVAGVMAKILGDTFLTPSQLKAEIQKEATEDKVTNLKSSTDNLLIFKDCA